MRSIRLALAGAAAIAAFSGCAGERSGAAPVAAATGQPAPSFSEKTASGSTLSLSDLKGRPLYLNFFASWCQPCNEEAPSINELQEKYRSRGLRVVGVDVLESQKKAAGFIAQHHLGYPAIVDDGTLRDQYNINGLPVHVFIDRSGVVKKIVVGELDKSEMESDIREVL